MGDIRDELLKAGLISERASQEIARARRAERRQGESSPDGLPEPADSRAAEEPGQEPGALVVPPVEIIRKGMVTPAPGNKRFHFVDRSGQIPFLELGEDTHRKLINGVLAIVESCGATSDEFVVVTEDTARSLARRAPDTIRFWNR
ncbi:hypothetical protein JXA88_11635 [Candidatus Fermentibacteria bacterium]|nr:hypothetical protein [Candidatus Fermentibacteria bacterium]